MFKWLLRRRAHKIALPKPRPSTHAIRMNASIEKANAVARSVSESLGIPFKMITMTTPSHFMDIVRIRELDREDHYTCVKCGHTHIVMKGE